MFALYHERKCSNVSIFFLDKHEILDLNGIDLPSHLKLLESYDFKSKLKSMPNLQELDIDENLINKVTSDYYDLINFPKIRKTVDSFSIFHLNLRSLTAHFHELQLIVSALKLNFDVIGISETKEQSSGFLSNADLDGYIFFFSVLKYISWWSWIIC